MSEAAGRIRWYRNLRWLGLPLLLMGLGLLVVAVAMVVTGQAPWHRILLGMLASGTALASFGVSNDTALALMKRQGGPLEASMQEELAQERERRSELLDGVAAQPKLAHAMPLVSAAVSALLIWRLLAPTMG